MQHENGPSSVISETYNQSSTVSSASDVTKSEVRAEKPKQIQEKKQSSALATIAGEPDTPQKAKKHSGDSFSKSLDTTSAKQVMARKLSDSVASSCGRRSPASLLDTGFSGTFDIRAKIEALEKKTNKKLTCADDDGAEEQSPRRTFGAEQKASATLVLSPKPVTPPSHRSIQVVSQTPRGITQNANTVSAKLSPPSFHQSQQAALVFGGRAHPARDALWSVKSVSDTDDRLTDIVASNRKMLHSDDTIERFTDFELGSS